MSKKKGDIEGSNLDHTRLDSNSDQPGVDQSGGFTESSEDETNAILTSDHAVSESDKRVNSMNKLASMLIPSQFNSILMQIEQNIQNSETVIANTLNDTRKMIADARLSLQSSGLHSSENTRTEMANEPKSQFVNAILDSQRQVSAALESQSLQEQSSIQTEQQALNSENSASIQQALIASSKIEEAEQNITNTIMHMNANLQEEFAKQGESIGKKQQVLQNLLANTQGAVPGSEPTQAAQNPTSPPGDNG